VSPQFQIREMVKCITEDSMDTCLSGYLSVPVFNNYPKIRDVWLLLLTVLQSCKG